MKSIDHLPEEERKHFIQCGKCGEWIDYRDLYHVFEREYAGLQKLKWGSSIRKGEATEYPNPEKGIGNIDFN